MPTIIATFFIDDIPATTNIPEVWTFQDGILPFIGEFQVPTGGGNLLLKKTLQKKSVTLKMSVNAQSLEVRNLWALSVQPSDNPATEIVEIADRRWFWNYAHILRRFNMRQRSGFKSIARNDLFELQDVVPEVWYWKWSTADGRGLSPWKATEALEDAIKTATAIESRFVTGGNEESGISPIFREGVKKLDALLPVEQQVLDDNGDTAIARIMSFLPGCAIFVDFEGNIIVRHKPSEDEGNILKNMGPPIVGGHLVKVVSNAAKRAKHADVLFTREIEVRFDSTEEGEPSGQTGVRDELKREIENVLPLPDVGLKGSDGKIIAQGTYVTFDQAFDLWGKIALPGGAFAPKLSHRIVRRGLIPFMDLFSAYGVAGLFSPNADWVARIAAVRQHYRKTFRLNSQWTERALSIKAERVATVDNVSGMRSRSPVFSDYAVIGNQKTFVNDPDLQFYSMNVDGYPAGGKIDSDTKLTPATVTILDADQGIVHVDYDSDNYGMYTTFLPSKISTSGPGRPASGNLRYRGRVYAFNQCLPNGIAASELTKQFKLAFIVTMIPASPNNRQQLHRVRVSPVDVQKLVGRKIADSNGPPVELRVGMGVETARVRWLDGAAARIEQAFGITPGEPNLSGLVINENPGQADEKTTGASLNNIALGVAARYYETTVDRYVGEYTSHFAPSVLPYGYASQISHILNPKGDFVTKVNFPKEIPAMELLGYLPSSTRNTILKVPPGKVA